MKIKKNYYHFPAHEADELREAYGEDNYLDGAIDVCRERARLYVMPATWHAKLNDDGSITVIRYHN